MQAILLACTLVYIVTGQLPGHVPYVAGLTGIVIATPILYYFEILFKRIADAQAEAKASKAILAIKVKELAIAKADAIDANRAKSAFLAQMSHELRTPLNAVIGFSDILVNQNKLGNGVTFDTTSYAQHILTSGHLLLSLVNDILDLAKIEAGEFTLELVPLNIGELVRDVIGATGPLANDREQNVFLTTPPENRLLEADERAVVQIAMNLISNAIKYSPNGTRIDVNIVYSEDSASIHINDQGPGMSEEEVRRAVEPYSRLNKDITRDSDGTGLGLPIVNSLISLHGGTLNFETRVGGGTCAVATFPNLASVQSEEEQIAA